MDYDETLGNLLFTSGTGPQLCLLQFIHDDLILEFNETITFGLNVVSPNGVTILNQNTTVVIVDNEGMECNSHYQYFNTYCACIVQSNL